MVRAVFITLPTFGFLLLFRISHNRLGAVLAGMILAWPVVRSGQRQPAIVRGLNLHFALAVPAPFLAWR